MIQVSVRYYAILREARGAATEPVETAAKTAGELYDDLRARHDLPLGREHVRAVLNGTVADWGADLRAGDSIEFLPPFAGG